MYLLYNGMWGPIDAHAEVNVLRDNLDAERHH